MEEGYDEYRSLNYYQLIIQPFVHSDCELIVKRGGHTQRHFVDKGNFKKQGMLATCDFKLLAAHAINYVAKVLRENFIRSYMNTA